MAYFAVVRSPPLRSASVVCQAQMYCVASGLLAQV